MHVFIDMGRGPERVEPDEIVGQMLQAAQGVPGMIVQGYRALHAGAQVIAALARENIALKQALNEARVSCEPRR